ncbi:uncharacterized protein LAESUDRAFT_728297 [Laetiporus sulphureus 93-53]|uniref:Uncharacterized protein n=1 Tax=Laetiporus sulphureus 93-53 TaxID=1314785 RepID=A0A165DA21_9APHY|nr:uncharacterized protein LAESUDRAFT_728297 [Laetiporus sulphureus 93-53]KZT04415.1 hypothetical protein LAESUDRAFT_728297 [Laetiporus sulphureus 93-53]
MARKSSSISDTAAEQEDRDVGLSGTTRAFDEFEAAAGKILGEEDVAERDALNHLLVVVGDRYESQM